jgi:hypothetical protein
MMLVHILDGLGNPRTMPASRVLVTTDDGTPLALSVALGPSLVESTHAGEPDFNVKLRIHGVDRTVQVDRLRAPRIADFGLKL